MELTPAPPPPPPSSGHGYLSELVVPIIENTPHEEDLADSLGEAIRQYPKATAVLVRRHGIYIWGSTWMQVRRKGRSGHGHGETGVLALMVVGIMDGLVD